MARWDVRLDDGLGPVVHTARTKKSAKRWVRRQHDGIEAEATGRRQSGLYTTAIIDVNGDTLLYEIRRIEE